MDENKITRAYTLQGLLTIFLSSVFIVFCLLFLIKTGALFGKLMMIPFLICGIANLVRQIMWYMKKVAVFNEQENKVQKIVKIDYWASLIYTFSFFFFWFGFLLFYDYLALNNWDKYGSQTFLFSLLFWFVGIKVLIKRIKMLKK